MDGTTQMNIFLYFNTVCTSKAAVVLYCHSITTELLQQCCTIAFGLIHGVYLADLVASSKHFLQQLVYVILPLTSNSLWSDLFQLTRDDGSLTSYNQISRQIELKLNAEENNQQSAIHVGLAGRAWPGRFKGLLPSFYLYTTRSSYYNFFCEIRAFFVRLAPPVSSIETCYLLDYSRTMSYTFYYLHELHTYNFTIPMMFFVQLNYIFWYILGTYNNRVMEM